MKKLRVPVSAFPFESVAVIWERAIGVFVMSAFGAENDSFTIALPLTFAMLIDENVDELRARIFAGFVKSRTSTKTVVDHVAAAHRGALVDVGVDSVPAMVGPLDLRLHRHALDRNGKVRAVGGDVPRRCVGELADSRREWSGRSRSRTRR